MMSMTPTMTCRIQKSTASLGSSTTRRCARSPRWRQMPLPVPLALCAAVCAAAAAGDVWCCVKAAGAGCEGRVGMDGAGQPCLATIAAPKAALSAHYLCRHVHVPPD